MVGIARLVAAGLGTGYVPVAPGTAGSLLALATGAVMLAASPWLLLPAALLATLLGLWAIPRAAVTGDPGWVVVDEIAGQWIALAALPRVAWPGLVLAFALFRLLDIAKPGPIGWADRQGGAFGIMIDDVLAGAIAAALLLTLRFTFPGVL